MKQIDSVNELIDLVQNELLKMANLMIGFNNGNSNDMKVFHEKSKVLFEYALENICLLKIKDDLAIEHEKLAELIAKLNSAFYYEVIYKTELIRIDKERSIHGTYFFKNNKIENLIIIGNPISLLDIKKLSQFKKSYIPDAEGFLYFENNAAPIFVHATANIDTYNGQGKQQYSLGHGKNIYIIKALINKNHRGLIIDVNNEDYEILNLLPFLSMLIKICYDSSKINLTENLIYFLKIPLILVGSNVWIKYNLDLQKILNQKEMDLKKIFFEFNEHKESEKVFVELYKFLFELGIKMIRLIKIDKYKEKYQDNEKILISQLYNYLKAVLFLSSESGVDFNNFEIDDFFKSSEDINHNYGGLNLRIELSYKLKNKIHVDFINREVNLSSPVEIYQDMFDDMNILTNNAFEIRILNFCMSKGKFTNKDLFNDFKNDISSKLKFNAKEKNCILSTSLGNENFEFLNEIINSKRFLKNFLKMSERYMGLTLDNYPYFFSRLEKQEVPEKIIKKIKFLTLFNFKFIPEGLKNIVWEKIYSINKEIFDNYDPQNLFSLNHFSLKESFSSSIENFWKVHLLSEYYYPLFDGKDFELKKTLYQYVEYILYYNKFMEKKEFKDLLKGLTIDVIKNNFDIKKQKEDMFDNLEFLYEKYNFAPNEYAHFITQIFGGYLSIELIENLSRKDKFKNLKDALVSQIKFPRYYIFNDK